MHTTKRPWLEVQLRARLEQMNVEIAQSHMRQRLCSGEIRTIHRRVNLNYYEAKRDCSRSMCTPLPLSHLCFPPKQEQNENPDATLQAIRFYSYSMKKKHTELFKPFLTEKEIKEEDEEILGCETSSKEDSLHSESSDNSGVILSTSPVPLPEKKRPPVPPKKPNTLVSRGKSSTTQNTFAALDEALNNLKMNCIGPEVQTETDKGKQETETESPILRKKERVMHKMTDEEVFVELRRICHPGDPYKRFERSKELGAG
uniref:Uncharacterized protein n=1 Tax=Timema tahoe TaxID=61484 RepID=A0A7R9IPR0_9NEOP|nr:unnamed protein product [Timema tahoe]